MGLEPEDCVAWRKRVSHCSLYGLSTAGVTIQEDYNYTKLIAWKTINLML